MILFETCEKVEIKDEDIDLLVDMLFDNMDGRSGFDTGVLDHDVMTEWKDEWSVMVKEWLQRAIKEA